MRLYARTTLLAALALSLSACQSVPVNPVYVDPAIASATTGTAVVVKEFCPGGGRGIIHFDGVDAVTFTPQFQTQKVVLAPGEHKLTFLYLAPGASWNVTGEAKPSARYTFQAGGHYVARYRRTDPTHVKIWIEPIDAARTDQMNTVCLQPQFEDGRYRQ